MGLHDRISKTTAVTVPSRRRAGADARAFDPYAELKAQVHHACIAKLGPELFNDNPQRPERRRLPRGHRGARDHGHAADARRAPRARPPADRRHPRLRPARALPRRRHRDRGHGQRRRERLRRAQRQDRAHPVTLRRRRAPDAHHRQDRLAGRPARRRVLADGGRAPPRRQPRQRDHPAARADRADADDPEVLARPVHDQRPDHVRNAVAARRAVPRRVRQGQAEHPDLRRNRHRQDDDAECRLVRSSPATSASSRSRTRPSSSCSRST